jgi:hypothetical protein
MTNRKHGIISQNQGRLPFGGRGKGGLLAVATPLERGIMAFAVFGFGLSAFLYMYFVMASVAHVASRGALEHEVALLSAEVAKLETRYLSDSRVITESYAKARGFVSVSNAAYVERASRVTYVNAP